MTVHDKQQWSHDSLYLQGHTSDLSSELNCKSISTIQLVGLNTTPHQNLKFCFINHFIFP